jgi:hypothetical protein
LAELKRTGGRSGLPELQADATKLKSEVEQLARRRRAGSDKSSLWNLHSS